MLPATLPHFVYRDVIDDFGWFLILEVPFSHRNIVVLANKITIKSDVVYPSTYTDAPANIHILCQTLTTMKPDQDMHLIDLSGENAKDMNSCNDDKECPAMIGKAGCDGGSITIYAVEIAGDGNLCIKTQGGNGGKGQDGYKGKPGENGGNGGSGGQGGKSGKIHICHYGADEISKSKFMIINNGGKGGEGGKKGTGGAIHLVSEGSGETGETGKDGEDGPVGISGETLDPQIEHALANNPETFYKPAPITAAYLQRTINIEKLRMIKAQQEKNQKVLQTVRTNLDWIKKIASKKKYHLLKGRCEKIIWNCSHEDKPEDIAEVNELSLEEFLDKTSSHGSTLKFEKQNNRKKPDPSKRRQPEQENISESGKFIGVLDKCEQVEDDSKHVVATFDSIKLEFTKVKGEKPVHLNDDLDEIQTEEFEAQLELQRSPLCYVLPAFIFTTILPIEQASEEDVGSWYEFNVDFERESDTSDAEIVVTAINIDSGKLSKTVCGVAEHSIPVTISPVTKLNTAIQTKIVKRLRLLPYSPEQTLEDAGSGITKLPRDGGNTKSSTPPSTTESPTKKNEKNPNNRAESAKLNKEDPTAKTNKSGEEEQTEEATILQAPNIARVAVVNVGQGSCNILYDNDENPLVVFDVGGNKRFWLPNRQGIWNDIHRAPIIILSHWDYDHYYYLLKDEHIGRNKTIIAPNFGSGTGPTARRLSTQLRERNTCRYYSIQANENFQNIPMLPGNVTLRVTTAIIRRQGKDKNNVGAITLSIENDENNSKILLPGDASYQYIDQHQQVNLRYLVATHHGSIKNIGTPPEAAGPGATVYFSYGLNNTHGHNVDRAMRIYTRRGWVNDPQRHVTANLPNNRNGINIDLVR